MEIRSYSALDKRETLLSKNFCVEIVEQTDNSVKIISRFKFKILQLSFKRFIFHARSGDLLQLTYREKI
jgi:hypothetical protein